MLKDKISLLFSLAQYHIHDMDPSDSSRDNAQNTLDAIKDALDDIQLDNNGQYVIYTGIFDEDEEQKAIYGEHVWKGASISDPCSLCGERYYSPVHPN